MQKYIVVKYIFSGVIEQDNTHIHTIVCNNYIAIA